MSHALAPGEPGLGSSSYAWSPDGSRIAYILGDLYTTAADGSDNQRANDPTITGGAASALLWSPDSTRIAYRASNRLYTATLAGSVIDEATAGMQDFMRVTDYKWSPDGTRIAYRVYEGDPEVTQLYTSGPDGTDRYRVNGRLVPAVPGATDGGNVALYQWSPNGTRIAYTADQDTDEVRELYTSRWDGSENRKINIEISPGGDFASTFIWSPDGGRLAHILYKETVLELYSTLPDGSDRHKVNGPLTANGDVSGFAWCPVPSP
jgi:Tol biopolymer transport system component